MSKKESSTEHPMRQAEESALNTYREWPVLLVLREKELQSHLAPIETEKVELPDLTIPQPEPKE
ncbi:MAG: hypothetical protein ABI947_04580 [Chloroflexota bacterium]